jgi:hypothetical protein
MIYERPEGRPLQRVSYFSSLFSPIFYSSLNKLGVYEKGCASIPANVCEPPSLHA